MVSLIEMDRTTDTVLTAEHAKSQLRNGQILDAVKTANRILECHAGDIETLYILAVAQRYLTQSDLALQTLERLIKASPEYGHAYQEQGHNYMQINNKMAAVRAYTRAVEFNPALIASWKALTKLYFESGDGDAAAKAQRSYSFLAKLPKELVSVSSLIHEGDIYKAEQLCRQFLRKRPHHIEAMRLLAAIGQKLNIYDDAEFLLESCLEFSPDYRIARFDYVNVLLKRQKFGKALEQAAALVKEAPGNFGFQNLFANANVMIGNHDEALKAYQYLLKQAPDNHQIMLSIGHVQKTIGQQRAAIDSYRRAYEVKHDCGDAYWSLANLKTYRFTDSEIDLAEQAEREEGVSLADRFHLCFALGKAHEDRGDIAKSFTYYERGNQLKKEQSRYSADRTELELKAQAKVFTSKFLDKLNEEGCDAPDPIFIVGLPRAGSTLLEQILASHSQVDGTFELPNILALAHKLNGRRLISEEARYPKVLQEIPADQLKSLGEAYITDTKIHRGNAPFFIDKMPNNFRHIGLIHLILPNAKIIDIRRHPMACCFSGFKQLFAEGQEFTYGLEEIGRYYKGYVDLMDHWDQVLPGKILRVQYEDVIDDLETQVRRILGFCRLRYEESCVEFYKTSRSVRTASSEQVRQPIYRTGLEQWKRYEAHLDPLKAALGMILERYPISSDNRYSNSYHD